MKRRLMFTGALICGAALLSSPTMKPELSALELLSDLAVPSLSGKSDTNSDRILSFKPAKKADSGIILNSELSTEINQTPQEPNDSMPPDSFVRAHVPGEFFRSLNPKLSERFSSKEPRFKAHKSCKLSPGELRKSFKDSIKESGIVGEQSLPETGAILDLNFYFQHADKYYQLSMEPMNRTLDEYRIALIQSTSPDFSADLVRVEDGRMSQYQHLARLDAMTSLKMLMDDYTSQGARWGTRTVLLAEVSSSDDGSAAEARIRTKVEFHDGAIWGFMNGQQECHLANDSILECLCW
jgi:hypothetical protein